MENIVNVDASTKMLNLYSEQNNSSLTTGCYFLNVDL